MTTPRETAEYDARERWNVGYAHEWPHEIVTADHVAHALRHQAITTGWPVTFGGVTVDAPGFTADQFERAICRALVDELEVHYDATGEVIICHRGQNGGYRVSRHTCSCKAGEVGTPCKHRALYCFHLDVREPALRRQWASARKQVA
jgi:hypothetical protein